MTDHLLSNQRVVLLACASAVVTANAYYIHPIIGLVASEFAVSHGLIGVVPALNQIALALGVLLLLPLGDRVSNRRLVALCLTVQVGALITMATVTTFWIFAAASTLLGFFTITPYLLPAYVSRQVEPGRLGFVTAVLTSGVIAGVQLSRLGSGVVAEYFSWRQVYWLAAALMAVSAVALPAIMGDRQTESDTARPGYFSLMGSLFGIARKNPGVMVSGFIQGCNFGIFIALWMGISLHLTSDTMGHGTALVGYLTAFSALGLLTTAHLGKVADQLGAERARMIMAGIQLCGIALFATAGGSWWYLLLPLAITSVVGPMVDVTGRMTSLNQPPGIRTRLMSLYITLMFLGGGAGSWAGTGAYDTWGWWGTVCLIVTLSLVVTGLSTRQYLRKKA